MATRSHLAGAEVRYVDLLNTADTGFTKNDTSLPIVVAGSYRELSTEVDQHVTYLELNTLIIAEGGAAAKAFGQRLFDFPKGFIMPIGAQVQFTIKTAATTATAGEIGLGSVIGSGANATLGAVGGTSEDIMEGTTLSNITTTATTYWKANAGVKFGTQGATSPSVIDGSATAVRCFLNICSTWGAAENCTLSGVKVTLKWIYLGRGA